MTNFYFGIKKQKETADFGQFVFEPLERGYGYTIGVALRRVLLANMPGAAVTQVKITGVRHQFSTLEGLKEDVVEFILNLKKLRIKYQGDKPVKLSLEASGPKEVKASDIKTPAEVKVVNPDLVLGVLADKKSKLKAEITVESGYGYSPAEERKTDKMGVIPVDASFSPIKRINYHVEATRVGRRTDLDRLIFDIYTDGTIKPSKALKEAAKILTLYFNQVVTPKKAPKAKEEKKPPAMTGLDLTVEELDLPTRIANALRRGGYGTLGDLVAANHADLSKVKNLGEKSIKVVEAALSEKGFSLKGS
jgi:DNA-directed RNA polymerase subunit alpha